MIISAFLPKNGNLLRSELSTEHRSEVALRHRAGFILALGHARAYRSLLLGACFAPLGERVFARITRSVIWSSDLEHRGTNMTYVHLPRERAEEGDDLIGLIATTFLPKLMSCHQLDRFSEGRCLSVMEVRSCLMRCYEAKAP